MFTVIPRALLAFGFVWLMIPHQPDLGLGRPQMIETLVSMTSAKVCAQGCNTAAVPVANLEDSRNAMLDAIARVRSDLHANGTQIGALSRNGAL